MNLDPKGFVDTWAQGGKHLGHWYMNGGPVELELIDIHYIVRTAMIAALNEALTYRDLGLITEEDIEDLITDLEKGGEEKA